jgi:DNA-3-methyladenine glycosylase II
MTITKYATFSLIPQGSYAFGLTLAYLRSSPSAIGTHITEHGFHCALDIGPGIVAAVERGALAASPEPLQFTVWETICRTTFSAKRPGT